MKYASPYSEFVFESYEFDNESGTAKFRYSFDGELVFTEVVEFETGACDQRILDSALKLAFLVAGTSYYKCFPTHAVRFAPNIGVTIQDITLLRKVYYEGLSQFVYENNLKPDDLVRFDDVDEDAVPVSYTGHGIVAMQSGGKDSLLLAELLKASDHEFAAGYVMHGDTYPLLLDGVTIRPLRAIRRRIDHGALGRAQAQGGLNGHVPVSYIMMSLVLIDAVLHGDNTVLAAIGNEGEEPHGMIGDYAINHQWSKTREAEKLLVDYVSTVLSPDLRIGSPLRAFSELRIAELFADRAWELYGNVFSSCNRGNYQQGHDNQKLVWCGVCAKCANSFLLFAPFVDPDTLIARFGHNLLGDPRMLHDYKGLLGVDEVMKPFECVGEVPELRLAYHMANGRYPGVYQLPFDVPTSDFDYKSPREVADWAYELISREGM